MFLISCGTASNVTKDSNAQKSAPDWVISGSSEIYTKAEFLTGVAYSPDKKSAEIAAIEALVSVFGQKVSSVTNASRRMERAQSQGIVATSDASTLDQSILREVNQNDVIAVEVPEFYESKSEGNWYALAVMNREKGTKIYSGMIQKNEAEIKSILNQVNSEKDLNTLLNFSRLDFAEEVAKTNELYFKRLSVLNPDEAKKFSSITTPVQIHKEKSEMAAKIPICVTVDSDDDGRIAKTFQEAMSSFGFNTTIGSNERYQILCKNHFTPQKSADGKTDFCEYTAECSLIDTFSGETLVPMSISGREGSPTYQNAEIRAKQKITTKIKGEFTEAFQKYLGDFSL